MTLRQNPFGRFFMYWKKWVKIALKYFAKLFFIGVVYRVLWGFGKRAFHGAVLQYYVLPLFFAHHFTTSITLLRITLL